LFNCAISDCKLGWLVAGSAACATVGAAAEFDAFAAGESAAEVASSDAAALPPGKTLPPVDGIEIDSDAWLPCTMLATDALTGTPLLAIMSPARTYV
jgi:hypothetical protein